MRWRVCTRRDLFIVGLILGVVFALVLLSVGSEPDARSVRCADGEVPVVSSPVLPVPPHGCAGDVELLPTGSPPATQR